MFMFVFVIRLPGRPENRVGLKRLRKLYILQQSQTHCKHEWHLNGATDTQQE